MRFKTFPSPLQQINFVSSNRTATAIYRGKQSQTNRDFSSRDRKYHYRKSLTGDILGVSNRQNATRLILTAFSINSIPIKIAIAFFLASTPNNPMQKSAAANIKYHEMGTINTSYSRSQATIMAPIRAARSNTDASSNGMT